MGEEDHVSDTPVDGGIAPVKFLTRKDRERLRKELDAKEREERAVRHVSQPPVVTNGSVARRKVSM